MRPLAVVFAFTLPASAGEPAAPYEEPVTAADRGHWAFKPVARPAVPGPGHPIDAFVRARLAKEGLAPSPPADRATLIRRVTFDLIGLPPTPAEVAAFLADQSPDAYEKVVDRLLASPHFGERWAQHWLDAVRFAESNGYEADADRPHAWRYRDYVVRSFNADKPYDQFVREQVAGDERAGSADPRTVADLLAATGLHRCGPEHRVTGTIGEDVVRHEARTEMVAGVGSAVLGLTVSCARCHDHKFDPVSQADYYRLEAFFAAVVPADVPIGSPAAEAERKAKADALHAPISKLKAEIAALDGPPRERVGKRKRDALDPATRAALDVPAGKRTPEQKKLAADAGPQLKVSWDELLAEMPAADRAKRTGLRGQLHALEAKLPPPPAAAWAVKTTPEVPPTHVLKRGELSRKGAVVRPAVPRVLAPPAAVPPTRTGLADWLTSRDNPLTARVAVNRLWQHHVGRGLVATPNDFGLHGETPTHPELLDWLAAELADRGWSLKHVHRRIVLSETYRQSSAVKDRRKAVESDSANALLWRMNRRRLEAETVRDAVLAASGSLNPAVGGRSVKVPLEPDVYALIFTEGEPDGLWPVTPDPAEHRRRSLYLFRKRNVRLPLLEAFDQPDASSPCPARPVSTFAPQSLVLMNGPFVRDEAKALAERLMRDHGDDAAGTLDDLYLRAFGRQPRQSERELAAKFLTEQEASVRERAPDGARLRALTDLCAAMFNTNEFVYVP